MAGLYPYDRKITEVLTHKLRATINQKQLSEYPFLRRQYLGFLPAAIQYGFRELFDGVVKPSLKLESQWTKYAQIVLLYPFNALYVPMAVGLKPREHLRSLSGVNKVRCLYRGVFLDLFGNWLVYYPVVNVLLIPLENVRLNYMVSVYSDRPMNNYRDCLKWCYRNGNLWRGTLWYSPILLFVNFCLLYYAKKENVKI
jgi:hypothetical protein